MKLFKLSAFVYLNINLIFALTQQGVNIQMIQNLYEASDIKPSPLSKDESTVMIAGTTKSYTAVIQQYLGVYPESDPKYLFDSGLEGTISSTSLAIDPVTGDIYVVGYTTIDFQTKQVNRKGYADYMLVKIYGSNKTVAYAKSWGTDEDDIAIGVALDQKTKSLFITGTVGGSIDGQIFKGGSDVILFRFDTYGNKIWTRTYGGNGYEFGWQVEVSQVSEAVYVVGFVKNINAFIQKWTFDGNNTWTSVIDQPSSFNSITSYISSKGQERLYVAGYIFGPIDGHNSYLADAFVTYYYPNGTRSKWSVTYGGSGLDYAYDLAISPITKDIFVVGTTNSRIDKTQEYYGQTDIFLTRISMNGSVVWNKQLGTSGDDVGSGITFSKNGDLYIAGTWNGKNGFIGYYTNQDLKQSSNTENQNQSNKGSVFWPIFTVLTLIGCAVFVVYKKKGPESFQHIFGRRARFQLPFFNQNKSVRLGENDDLYEISPSETHNANLINVSKYNAPITLQDDQDLLDVEQGASEKDPLTK